MYVGANVAKGHTASIHRVQDVSNSLFTATFHPRYIYNSLQRTYIHVHYQVHLLSVVQGNNGCLF